MRFFLFPLALIYSALLCSQDLNLSASLLEKSLTENANAVVRLDEMKVNILASNKMQYSVKQVITVLNKLGDRYSQIQVGYDKEKKIKNLDVYVYDKLGKEINHIKKKDFQDVSAADGFSLYTDDRILRKMYTPINYPYTISISYNIETSDTCFFPPWYFLPGYMVSVEKSHYEVSYSTSDLKPDVKEFNLEGISLSKVNEPDRLAYKAENILAIKSEAHGPTFSNIVPRLSLKIKKFNLKGENAEVNNWKEMGLWINNALLNNRDILPTETIVRAGKLVEGIDDDLEKAKIIYKYVQDNTRYISVQIGIGGWKPISALDVDQVKYGDCKGLSNYTHALLKAVGVKSYYTVIHAGNQKVNFDPDFSALQGNHAILAIPYKEKYYWIDCTSQTHPFGFVGDFTDDRLALVIKPDGGEVVKTVSYLDEENSQRTTAKYTIGSNGSISGNVEISTRGIQYDNRFHLENETHENIIKHYKDYWDNINNLVIKENKLKNDRENIVFTENISIDATNYAASSGNRMFFTVNAFNKNSYVPNRYRNRQTPLVIQRGYLDEDEYIVKIPDTYNVEGIPDEKVIENEFGHYKTKFIFNEKERTISYKRSMMIKEGYYPKEKYKEYRNFRKETASADNAKVVLIKS